MKIKFVATVLMLMLLGGVAFANRKVIFKIYPSVGGGNLMQPYVAPQIFVYQRLGPPVVEKGVIFCEQFDEVTGKIGNETVKRIVLQCEGGREFVVKGIALVER